MPLRQAGDRRGSCDVLRLQQLEVEPGVARGVGDEVRAPLGSALLAAADSRIASTLACGNSLSCAPLRTTATDAPAPS